MIPEGSMIGLVAGAAMGGIVGWLFVGRRIKDNAKAHQATAIFVAVAMVLGLVVGGVLQAILVG